MLSHHVEFHIAITTHIPDWLNPNSFSHPSNLSSMPVQVFCFVIHIISGISSRLRGHFYFAETSAVSLMCLCLVSLILCLLLFYPLRLFHPKGIPWFSRALPRGKALLSTPLTLRCFQSRWCVSVPGIPRLSASTECHRADAPVSYI